MEPTAYAVMELTELFSLEVSALILEQQPANPGTYCKDDVTGFKNRITHLPPTS